MAVVCFGCEIVTQSLWSEAEAEVEDAGGVGDLSMVLTPIHLGGTPPVEGGLHGAYLSTEGGRCASRSRCGFWGGSLSRRGRIGLPVRRVIEGKLS